MLENSKNYIFAVLLGLIFALAPVSLVQAASPVITFDVSGITIGNITSVNGKSSLEVTGLPVGAIVKVYDQESNGKLLGSGTVKTGQTSVVVSLPNLNSDVYVSVTLESAKSNVTVKKTDQLTYDSIKVNNNAGIADTVTVTDLKVGDTIKVYDYSLLGEASKLLGTATVAKGKSEAVVSITQLDPFTDVVMVTLTSIGEKESDPCASYYSLEPMTSPLEPDTITIMNNAGIADTVTVTDLKAGDIVKVYESFIAELEPKLLAKATVAKGKTEVVISITQLSPYQGWAGVSVNSLGENESYPIFCYYSGESVTDSLTSDRVTVINNAGTADTVTVSELEVGDVVKVYNATLTKLLGTTTVAKGKTEAIVSIKQLGTETGEVNVRLKSYGKQEFVMTSNIIYDAEPQTYALGDHNITVLNYAGLADTVTVTDLEVGDIVKVYNAIGTRLLGSANVAKGKTETVVSIRQLGTDSGAIWVAITSIGKQESERLEKLYDKEEATNVPAAGSITAINNKLKNDSVTVTGLEVGDIVKVYNAATQGKTLGTAKVGEDKIANVTIRQLGKDGGTVYVTVTSKGKLETSRILLDFNAETD